MISQSFALAAAAAALAAARPAEAPMEPAEPVAAQPAEVPACCAIAAMTEVEIEIAEHVTSKSKRQGEPFAIRLAEPIVVEGRLLVPAGTPGVGEVVHSAKAGAAGKAGELILAARYLELDGRRIPLRSFRYGRRQGKDKSGAVNTGNMVAAAVLPAASVVGFLIKGGEVDIPAGTRAHAKVSAATSLPPRD